VLREAQAGNVIGAKMSRGTWLGVIATLLAGLLGPVALLP
jgi:hypothetical protein